MRWGILGCGKISNDFVHALHNSGPDVQVVACAAQSMSSATDFGARHDIPICLDSYAALCALEELDIIYVGTIHIKHHAHARLALSNGKHCLVEKPIGMNVREISDLMTLATDQHKFLMESMWTRFFPFCTKVRQLLFRDRAIGRVTHVNADFGLAFAPDNARMWTNALGGGGLLDIGIYPLAFVVLAFGGEAPLRVMTAGGVHPAHQVDVWSNVSLEYSGHRFGSVQTSMVAKTPEVVDITGERGRIRIHAPAHVSERVSLTRFGQSRTSGDDSIESWDFPHPVDPKGRYNFPGSAGFQYEIESVEACVARGEIENPVYTWKEMLTIAQIIETAREQIGLVYPQDHQVV